MKELNFVVLFLISLFFCSIQIEPNATDNYVIRIAFSFYFVFSVVVNYIICFVSEKRKNKNGKVSKRSYRVSFNGGL